MRPAHPVLSDGWHLRGKMPFIIILWTLIDMLFDQRRYPGWICGPRCQKCTRSSRRIASSVSIIAVCSLCIPSLLVFSRLPDIFESHITFQTVLWKRSNILSYSLPSLMCKPEPSCSGWNGSWSKTAANQGENVEQDPLLLSGQTDLTSCKVQHVRSYLTCTTTPVLILILSNRAVYASLMGHTHTHKVIYNQILCFWLV